MITVTDIGVLGRHRDFPPSTSATPWKAARPRSSGTPPDPGEDLRCFVEAVTAAGTRERDGGWLGGLREYVADAGPVPSSRFL